MIYRVEYIDNGKGKSKKLAHPVKDRKALMALRDSAKNLNNLEKARRGDAEAKAKLLQLAYNIGHVEGLLAGCKSIGAVRVSAVISSMMWTAMIRRRRRPSRR